MTSVRSFVVAAGFAAVTAISNVSGAKAAGDVDSLTAQPWSFKGIFGTFENAEVQRGLQVYLEVCSSCHGLRYIAFRNLAAIGYDEEQIKAIAGQYEVEDGPNNDGEMFTRAAQPSDYFVNPFANEKEAAAMNNGAMPPDLSLIYKARPGGADYIYGLLNGYDEEGEHEVPDGLYYNAYFPGGEIAMPQPLYGDDVEYADGTAATVEQESRDVTAFLSWAAEPTLGARKKLGMKVLLFLVVLSALLFASKRKIWREIH